MATNMLDEIVQEHWSKFKKFTKSSFYFNTADGVEEYTLDKLAGDIVKNTIRGTDPVRMLSFNPSHDFYYAHQRTLEDGDPYYYRDGEYIGCQNQPSTASLISFVSSLANYTTGTLNVVYGSRKITITTGAFTLDMLGCWIKVGTDSKCYKITSFESSSVVYVSEPYEGTTNTAATFALGDVQQRGVVLGMIANGSILEEEVQLNGATSVSTVNFFSSIIRISKSDKTYGYMTATSNGGLITNAILDPGETESEWRTVKFYPIPTKIERINYESNSKHPHLYRNTDSPLFPSKFHGFLQLELFIRLRTEWTDKQVDQETIRRRDSMLNDMIVWDNDLSEWDAQQEQESDSSDRISTNLPNNFPEY